MSKPYKSDKKEQFFEVYKKKACNISVTCEAIGISRETYYQWRKEQDFDNQCRTVEESLVDMAETQLLKNIRSGNQRAVEFFLKNKAPDRWKDKHDYQHSGEVKAILVIDRLDEDKKSESAPASANGT